MAALGIPSVLGRGTTALYGYKISFNERGNYRAKVTWWARKVLQAKSYKVETEVFLLFRVS